MVRQTTDLRTGICASRFVLPWNPYFRAEKNMKASDTGPRALRHNVIRGIIRLVAILVAALIWLPFATACILIAALFGRRSRYRMVSLLTRPFCATMAALMGLRVRIEGRPAPGVLIFVANHVSWFDILVAGMSVSGMFVSRHDVKDWPLIGLFARLAATVFIDRSSLRSAVQSSRSIMLRARDGMRVVFFPEGGASSGDEVISFKPFLFGGIVEGGFAVQPFTIRYTHIGDAPVVPSNRDTIFWYRSDQNFLSQAWGILKLPCVRATAAFRQPLPPPKDNDRTSLRTFVEELRDRTAEGVPVWGGEMVG